MSKKPTRVLPAETLTEDTQKLYDVLNAEPDHSVIIVSASYLDACLGAILTKFLIGGSSTVTKMLNPGGGVLGTFSARCDLSYAAGLISEVMHKDLSVIAEMRNQCAHHYLLKTFADKHISDACEKLSFAGSLLRWDGVDGPMFPPEHLTELRWRFTITAILLSQRILMDAGAIEPRQRRQPVISTSDRLTEI